MRVTCARMSLGDSFDFRVIWGILVAPIKGSTRIVYERRKIVLELDRIHAAISSIERLVLISGCRIWLCTIVYQSFPSVSFSLSLSLLLSHFLSSSLSLLFCIFGETRASFDRNTRGVHAWLYLDRVQYDSLQNSLSLLSPRGIRFHCHRVTPLVETHLHVYVHVDFCAFDARTRRRNPLEFKVNLPPSSLLCSPLERGLKTLCEVLRELRFKLQSVFFEISTALN